MGRERLHSHSKGFELSVYGGSRCIWWRGYVEKPERCKQEEV